MIFTLVSGNSIVPRRKVRFDAFAAIQLYLANTEYQICGIASSTWIPRYTQG
jgi:hypothetical protein